MIVMGIDPGQTGGIGVLKDGKIVHACPLPVFNKIVDVRELVSHLDMWQPELVVIELQSIMGQQRGAMAIGANYGRIMAAVEMKAWSHRIVAPAIWNRAAQVPPKLAGRAKKEASFAAARRTWGQAFDDLLLKASQDGVVEALLIARYGA